MEYQGSKPYLQSINLIIERWTRSGGHKSQLKKHVCTVVRSHTKKFFVWALHFLPQTPECFLEGTGFFPAALKSCLLRNTSRDRSSLT